MLSPEACFCVLHVALASLRSSGAAIAWLALRLLMYPPVSLVRIPGGQLFRKHLALTASAMALLLAVSSAIDIWWSYRDQEALLIRIQRVHADAAAARIADFVRGIEAQLNWMTLPIAPGVAVASSRASWKPCGFFDRYRRSPSWR